MAPNGFNIQNDVQALTILLKLIKTAPNKEARTEAMRVALILHERMTPSDVAEAIHNSDTSDFIKALWKL